MKQKYSDQEIIEAIQAGGISSRRMTNYLFDQYQGLVIREFADLNYPKKDSADTYTDAIIGMSRQVLLGKFRGDSKISSYLIQIFFNLCKNKVRDTLSKRQEWVDELPDLPEVARNMLEEMIANDKIEVWLERFGKLGETCKKILWDWGFHGYTLQEIAERMGFSSTKSVSSKKYTCIQRLKELLEQENE